MELNFLPKPSAKRAQIEPVYKDLQEDGAAHPHNGSHADPRIKSPDVVLQQKAPNKAAILTEELRNLREKYDHEVEIWKDYAQKVDEWKRQMVEIINRLKAEVAQKNDLQSELHRTRELLKLKDLQLAQFIPPPPSDSAPKKQHLIKKIFS